MPPVRQRARTTRAVENDERILSAATALIVEQGVDAFGLRDVAAAAGLTYGALYGRYDNLAELLTDLWCRRLGAQIERLIDVAGAAVTTGSLPPIDLAWVTSPPPELTAAVRLCAVTPRIDELGDVVPVQIESWLTRARASSGSTEGAVLLGVVALLIGAVFAGGVHDDGDRPVRAAARWMHDGNSSWVPMDGPTPAPVVRPRHQFGVDDLLLDGILQATMDVVARSGMRQTTLKRIGRVAGCAPSSVYAYYGARDDLLVDLVTRSVWHARAGLSECVLAPVPVAAALVAGVVRPEARRHRRMSVEVVLAACHDHRLAAVLEEADRSALAEAAGGLVPDPSILPQAVTVLTAARDMGLGVELLADLVDLRPVDWRPFCSAFRDGLSGG